MVCNLKRKNRNRRRRLAVSVIALVIVLSAIILTFYLYENRPSSDVFVSKPQISQFVTEYPTQSSSTAPNAIAVDSNGEVWFSLWNLSSLAQLYPENGTIHYYHIPGLKNGNMITWGIAVDNSLRLLWLTEFGSNSIWRYNMSNSIFTQFKLRTPNAGPFGIALDTNHTVWFTELFGNKIGEISAQGSMTELSLPNSGTEPSGITTDAAGEVWFTLPGINSIGSYYQGKFGIQNLTGVVSTPVGIALDTLGNVWMTQHGPSFITEYNPQTHYLKTISTSNNSLSQSLPYFCWVDKNGNVWFNEHQGNAMSEFVPKTNSLIEYFIPTRIQSVGNISYMLTSALSPDGEPWYTEYLSGKIGTIHENASPEISLKISNYSESRAILPNGRELSYQITISNTSSPVLLKGYVGNFTNQGNFSFHFIPNMGSGTFDSVVTIKNDGALPGIYFVTLTARTENVAISQIIEIRVP
jgi:virginiamycin B lyase